MKRFIFSALFFVALLSIWHLLVLAKVWSVVAEYSEPSSSTLLNSSAPNAETDRQLGIFRNSEYRVSIPLTGSNGRFNYQLLGHVQAEPPITRDLAVMSGVNARRFSERTRDCHCGLCNTCWIINCRFPEAVQLANLCTVILNSAPAPLILFELLRCDFDRFAINSTTVGTADACCGRYASN